MRWKEWQRLACAIRTNFGVSGEIVVVYVLLFSSYHHELVGRTHSCLALLRQCGTGRAWRKSGAATTGWFQVRERVLGERREQSRAVADGMAAEPVCSHEASATG